MASLFGIFLHGPTKHLKRLVGVSVVVIVCVLPTRSFASDPILAVIEAGRQDTLSSTSVIKGLVNAGFKPSQAAQRLVDKLIEDHSDACVVINSDSTGAGSARWPHKMALWLAQKYPRYGVAFNVWNDKESRYVSSALQAGTGSHTLEVFNAGVPGTQPQYLLGKNFENAYGVCDADLIIINHGHNDDKNSTVETHRAMLLAVANSIEMKNPSAGVIIVAQNPLRDSEDGTKRSVGALSAALSMRYGLVDAFDLFESAGKPPAWYQDNIHPSDLGDTKIFELLKASMEVKGGERQNASTLAQQRINLLSNGNFVKWADHAPKDWDVRGLVAERITQGGHGNVTLIPYVAREGDLHQSLPADMVSRLRGKWVTLAVREWIPGVNPDANAGAIEISTDHGSNRSYGIPRGGRDGFRWLSVSQFVPMQATKLDVAIFATLSGTDEKNTTAVDRAVLVEGTLPFDMKN